jgi:6-phosphogluconolactonase
LASKSSCQRTERDSVWIWFSFAPARDPSGGRTPRNITIDPTNQFLIAANQAGENLVVFRIDSKTGNLTPTGTTGQVPQPGGVYFVKVQ